jgi:hypothetical protein
MTFRWIARFCCRNVVHGDSFRNSQEHCIHTLSEHLCQGSRRHAFTEGNMDGWQSVRKRTSRFTTKNRLPSKGNTDFYHCARKRTSWRHLMVKSFKCSDKGSSTLPFGVQAWGHNVSTTRFLIWDSPTVPKGVFNQKIFDPSFEVSKWSN